MSYLKHECNFIQYHPFLNSNSSQGYSVYEANTCIQFPNIDTRRLLLKSNTCKDIAKDIFSPITYYIQCHYKCNPNKMSLLGKKLLSFCLTVKQTGVNYTLTLIFVKEIGQWLGAIMFGFIHLWWREFWNYFTPYKIYAADNNWDKLLCFLPDIYGIKNWFSFQIVVMVITYILHNHHFWVLHINFVSYLYFQA